MMTDTPGMSPAIMYNVRNIITETRVDFEYVFSPISDIIHLAGGAFHGLDDTQTMQAIRGEMLK